MGTIKGGWWEFRFLISPDEFNDWMDSWREDGFMFGRGGNHWSDSFEAPSEQYAQYMKEQYAQFYDARMNPQQEIEPIRVRLGAASKAGFPSKFSITQRDVTLFPDGKYTIGCELFVAFFTPSQDAVVSDDRLHFTYEDIRSKSPSAYEVFTKFRNQIIRITRPLYYRDKPFYSVRISKQAYSDLLRSAFIKQTGKGLSSKW